MGFIRGALVVIACVILFVVFLLGNLFLTFSLSLKYDNVKNEIGPAVVSALSKNVNITEEFESHLPAIEFYCRTNSEYILIEGGYTFKIPCSAVSQGFDAVVEAGVQSILIEAYYEDYDCSFIDCFEQNQIPLFLVSDKARLFWKAKFYFALTLAIILIAILFLLFEKKHNTFTTPGILLILASLPFIKLNLFLSSDSRSILFSFLGIFVSKAHQVFILGLIIGILLLIVGIILQLFSLGFGIKELLDKFRKNKETEESNKKIEKLQKEVSNIKNISKKNNAKSNKK